MYNNFFGFSEEPFNVTPDPRFLYLTPSHREALASMMYAIKERKGFISITGEVGTGKTTLVHTLLAKLDRQVKAVFIFHTHVSFEELLKAVLRELDIPIADGGKASLLHSLNESLIQRLSQNENVALIIDEAQNLGNEVLEELRLLSNLETPKAKLLQILLVGQPELEAKLNSPELRQLKQRIGIRRKIQPLSPEECEIYIDHRLKQVGSSASKIFTKEAIGLISIHSQGIPRMINTICDNALLIGYGLSRKTVDGAIVREVLKDMGEVSLPPGEVSPPPAEASPPPPKPDRHKWESREEPEEIEPREAHSSSQPSSLDTAHGNPAHSSSQSGPWPIAHGNSDHNNLPAHTENRKYPHARLFYVGLALVAVLALLFFFGGGFYSGKIKEPEPSPKASVPSATPESSSESQIGQANVATVNGPAAAPAAPVAPLAATPAAEKATPLKDAPSLAEEKPIEERKDHVISAKRKDSIFLLARKYYKASNETLADLILEANPEITNAHVITVNQEIRIPEISEESLIVHGPDNGFRIHLGTFTNRRSPKVFERDPSLKGKELEFIPRMVSPRETWYRVLAGKYNNREECLKVIHALKKKGLLPAFSS
jgi:type II secretory pathway predicted ATPase ExeA